MSNKLIAYHFTGNTMRDNSPIPPIGKKLIVNGDIIPCEWGLHASEHPFDALHYAPGHLLHLVELSGTIIHDTGDKVVASERTILKSFDATELLYDFACQQALSVIHLWNPSKIVLDYLKETNPIKRSALRAAARGAARDAARGAAWDAAWGAAWDAAWGAARGAARGAAWDAAWHAARGAQRKSFKLAVDSVFDTL